jgi:ABC-type branched-subunit amino acid transport system ATPase component
MEFAEFDRRPILVAIAGLNGAGKTTFLPDSMGRVSIGLPIFRRTRRVAGRERAARVRIVLRVLRTPYRSASRRAIVARTYS